MSRSRKRRLRHIGIVTVVVTVSAGVIYGVLWFRAVAGLWQTQEAVRLLSHDLSQYLVELDDQGELFPDETTFLSQPGVAAHMICPHCKQKFIYTPMRTDGSRISFSHKPPHEIILRSPCLHRGNYVVMYNDFWRTLLTEQQIQQQTR